MNQHALQGLRVIDVSQIMAGPYCTMVLGDLGADVIKIEKVNGGDDTRQMGPFVEGESLSFFQINRNKRSIAIDLKTEAGRKVLYELVAEADVFIENYRHGVVQSLQIDYDSLKEINPGLVYCSISGYGQTGPYSHKGGFDLVAQGMSGLMSVTGEPGGRPLKSGIAVYDIGAGITAVYSILAAYIHKQNTGIGQHIDISLTDVGLPWFVWEAAAYFGNGTEPQPSGWRHRVLAPYQALRTGSGYIMLGCANQRTWEKFCTDVIERPDWIEDERFIDNASRCAHVEQLEAEIEQILTAKPANVWLERCEKSGVPAGPINSFAAAVQDPHYQARDMIVEMDHPTIGKMNMIGIPTKLSRTPGTIRQPSPGLGQHTAEILASVGYNEEQIQLLLQEGVVK